MIYTAVEYVLCILLVLLGSAILFLGSVLVIAAREAAKLVEKSAREAAGRLVHGAKTFDLAAALWSRASTAHTHHP